MNPTVAMVQASPAVMTLLREMASGVVLTQDHFTSRELAGGKAGFYWGLNGESATAAQVRTCNTAAKLGLVEVNERTRGGKTLTYALSEAGRTVLSESVRPPVKSATSHNAMTEALDLLDRALCNGRALCHVRLHEPVVTEAVDFLTKSGLMVWSGSWLTLTDAGFAAAALATHQRVKAMTAKAGA